MNLHENQSLFEQAIIATAQHNLIPEQLIEKDYWVTTVLKSLSKSDKKNYVVLKGGTSLSKVYNVINRFSEDIDFAVINSNGLRKKAKLRFLKEIETVLGQTLTCIEGHEKENKQSDIRKTIYKYPDIFDRSAIFVKPLIEIEISVFSRPHPYALRSVESYIAQFLQLHNPGMIEEYSLNSFEINVLDIQRTYFEKILALTRHSHYERQRLLNRVRHFYDIHMITTELGPDQILSEDFKVIIADIRLDDKMHSTFKGNLEYHNVQLCEAPLFAEWESIWSGVKGRYRSELSELCWSESIPSEKDITKTFRLIGAKLKALGV